MNKMRMTFEEIKAACLEDARIGIAQVLDGTAEKYQNILLCGDLVSPHSSRT